MPLSKVNDSGNRNLKNVNKIDNYDGKRKLRKAGQNCLCGDGLGRGGVRWGVVV